MIAMQDLEVEGLEANESGAIVRNGNVEKEIKEALTVLSEAQKQRIIGFATCLLHLQAKEKIGEPYHYQND